MVEGDAATVASGAFGQTSRLRRKSPNASIVAPAESASSGMRESENVDPYAGLPDAGTRAGNVGRSGVTDPYAGLPDARR